MQVKVCCNCTMNFFTEELGDTVVSMSTVQATHFCRFLVISLPKGFYSVPSHVSTGTVQDCKHLCAVIREDIYKVYSSPGS